MPTASPTDSAPQLAAAGPALAQLRTCARASYSRHFRPLSLCAACAAAVRSRSLPARRRMLTAWRAAWRAGWMCACVCVAVAALLAAPALAAARVSAAAGAIPQPTLSSAVAGELDPHPHPSQFDAPSPLPVFEGGLWSGDRVFIPAAQCSHQGAVVAQDTRPGHELDWFTVCDVNEYVSNFGVWSRENDSLSIRIAGEDSNQIRGWEQDENSDSAFLIRFDDDPSGLSSLYQMDADVGQPSLRRLLGPPQCIPNQVVHFAGELLIVCADLNAPTGTLISVWLHDLSTQRVVMSNVSSGQPMERVGDFVIAVLGFSQIYTYQLGAGRNTQLQPVFLESTALCPFGVTEAFCAGEGMQILATCAGAGLGDSSLLIYSPSSHAVTRRVPLSECSDSTSIFDPRTGALLIGCPVSPLQYASWLWTESSGLSQLTAPDRLYPLGFDRADSSSLVFIGVTQAIDGQRSMDVRSVSGAASTELVPSAALCANLVSLAVDEVRQIQWAVCNGPNDVEFSPGYALRLQGLVLSDPIPLPPSCMNVQSAVVPTHTPHDLLITCFESLDAHGAINASAIVSIQGPAANALFHLPVQWIDLHWLPQSQVLFALSGTGIDRFDLVSGAVVSLVQFPNGAGGYAVTYGFFRSVARSIFLFGWGEGILSIPSDALAPVQPTTVVPLSACAQFQDVQFDEGANTLWVACETQMLVWNLTSGAPSTSVQPFAYPLSGGETLTDFRRDPATGVISYLVSSVMDSSVMVFVDRSGAVLRDGTCFEAANVVLDRSTSVLYAACGSGNLVAFSTAFGCTSGSSWSVDSCRSCAIGSAHAVAPFDPHQRRVSQCLHCPSGWVAPDAGSTECTPCPVGQFLADPADQACSSCQPGHHQNATGMTLCYACAPGRYASDIQFVNCTLAPPGSFVQFNRSSAFTLCSRGSASNVYGLDKPCQECRVGFEAPQFGETECTACKLGSSAATGGFCSPCPVATYTPSAGAACVQCTDSDQAGLFCNNGVALVKEGWWAYAEFDAAQNASVFRTTPCPFGFCPGVQLQQSSNDTALPKLCTPPRLSSADNWLCAACDPGYIPWGERCERCSGPNAALILACVFACFLIVCYLLAAGVSSAGQVGVLLYFVQIAALELPPAADWLGWIKFANLGASSVHSCLAPLTPLQQIALTFATPFILCVVLALVAALHLAMSHCCCRCCSASPRLQATLTRSRYLNTTLGLFLFSYTAVSLACMQALHCVRVAPGVSRLYAAPTVDCDSDEYRRFLHLVILMLCVFVIGTPLAMLFVLWRRRSLHRRAFRREAKQAARQDLSLSLSTQFQSLPPSALLHLGFTDSAWFWQPLILLRRFIFAAVAVLLVRDPVTRNVLYILLHVAFLLLHQTAAPFASDELNRVERGSYVILFALSCFLATLDPPFSLASQVLLLMLVAPAALLLLVWTLHYKLPGLRARLATLWVRAEPDVDASISEYSLSASPHSLSLSLDPQQLRGMRRGPVGASSRVPALSDAHPSPRSLNSSDDIDDSYIQSSLQQRLVEDNRDREQL